MPEILLILTVIRTVGIPFGSLERRADNSSKLSLAHSTTNPRISALRTEIRDSFH